MPCLVAGDSAETFGTSATGDTMDKHEKLFYKLYHRLYNRVHKGSPAHVFNQAAEMLYHIDLMITMHCSEEEVYTLAKSYQEILYEKDHKKY